MRTINFRGQREDTKEWVYGDFIHYNEQFMINVYETEFGCWAYQVPIIPETVGQFTGLYDDNVKEIYEGDIVKVFYSAYEKPTIHEVRYFVEEDDYPAFDLEPCIDFADGNSFQYAKLCHNIEVIGNIYDNKEET